MSDLLRSSLGVVCPTCDFLNVVGANRCMSCGSLTELPPGSSPPARTDKHAAYVPEAAAPSPAPAAVPPGLKRANTGPSIPAVAATPPPEAAPTPQPGAAPTRSLQGNPPRPTFQSSSAPPPPAQTGPRYGMSVQAGPARGQRFRLGANGAQIGRSKGVILFPDDPFVSPLHATVSIKDGKLIIRDEDSTSGIYVSVNGQETIGANSYFATGLRLFHYVGALESAPPPAPGRLQVYGAPVPPNTVNYAVEEILLGGRPGRAMITAGPILTVGQSKCDLSFPNDDGMATRHCELSPMPTGAMIRDLSGGLGTFIRVGSEPRTLKAGDRVRIGQQTLQVELLS